MAVKIGIPRALGYYYLYPFYKTFLEQLGAEVVVSPPTTNATLDRIEACPTDEPCVAVKLYFAHTEKLGQMGVDYIFNPVLARMEKDNFCCPKFLGIADMVRNGLRLEDSMLLSPRFDCESEDADADKPFLEAGAKLGLTDRGRIRHALKTARQAQRDFEELMATHRLTIPEAFEIIDGKHPPKPISGSASSQAIGVIGHPYILYDMLSHKMIERLQEFGSVITAEMVSKEDVNSAMTAIPEGHKMWCFEAHMLGAALHLLRNHLIDKIILVGSFECGPESIIESYIQHEAERLGIPFLLLTVDEQTGEAGLITRIEAFMDTAPAESGRRGGSASFIDTLPAVHSDGRDKMLVGFPSMGFLDIAIRTILEDCGTECLKTPKISKRSIELGSELVPEFVCFPLTATLGQMREILDAGANTLFMVGGKGRCRLGWYAQIQEQLLQRAGYDFEMISLGSPVPLGTNWGTFRDALKRLSGNAPWVRIIRAVYFGYLKLLYLDRAEAFCHKMRAIERYRGTTDKLFNRFIRKIERASDVRTTKQEMLEFQEAVRSIETEDTRPLKVRIAGEIWVVLEHFVNQEIEKMLASQDSIRVEVDRELSASHWFRQNVLSDPALKAREHKVVQAASKFLNEPVGGHGQESVGATVLAREEGCDGVVHIFPFTCMPEIVAQNILVRVSEELDIPVLTFIVSEQTGEAGIQTRVEAFLDVLEERRQYRRDFQWQTTSA